MTLTNLPEYQWGSSILAYETRSLVVDRSIRNSDLARGIDAHLRNSYYLHCHITFLTMIHNMNAIFPCPKSCFAVIAVALYT